MQVSVENCCLLYRGKHQKENGGEYISVVLALVVFFVCAVSAYAISFFDMDSARKSSILDKSSTTATCQSSFIDGTGVVTRIKMTQTLEKQGFLWSWSTYAGEWTKTTYGCRQLSQTRFITLKAANTT